VKLFFAETVLKGSLLFLVCYIVVLTFLPYAVLVYLMSVIKLPRFCIYACDYYMMNKRIPRDHIQCHIFASAYNFCVAA